MRGEKSGSHLRSFRWRSADASRVMAGRLMAGRWLVAAMALLVLLLDGASIAGAHELLAPSNGSNGGHPGGAQTSGSARVGAAPVTGDPQTPGPVRARTPGPSESSIDDRLLEALNLHPGSVVAEIGAGAGRMTLRAAEIVGPTGRVYTTELGDDRLRALRRAIEEAGATNVTVVDGDPNQTNLPEACCDALFMQNVYHHFANPAAMNASLLKSLKPGGTLAITDFPPNKGPSAAPEHRAEDGSHGVSADAMTRELTGAGFELVTPAPGSSASAASEGRGANGGFLVVVRKPAR